MNEHVEANFDEGPTATDISLHIASQAEEGRIARELSNQDSPLLRLPAELRNWIYTYALPDEEHVALAQPEYGWHYAEEYDEYGSIFQVCRVLRAESEAVFFSSKYIELIYICWYDDVEGGMGGLLKRRMLEKVGNMSAAAVSCIRNITIDITLDDNSWEYEEDRESVQCQLKVDCPKAQASITVWREEWLSQPIFDPSGTTGEEYWKEDLREWLEEFNRVVADGHEQKRLSKAQLERLVFCMFHDDWYYLSLIEVC